MELEELLGTRTYPAEVIGNKIKVEDRVNYILETYSLELNDSESVPAYLALPKNIEGLLPVVLFLHSHGGNYEIGKSELIESPVYLQKPSYAETLTSMGYAVWSIDAWGFEDRSGVQESELVKQFLLEGKTLWGMRLFDLQSLLDYIENRDDMDSKRIGTIGMSMGGMLSWWLAAIDKRVSVCVDIAGQVDLETMIEMRRLDHHGFYYYVPRLLQYYSTVDIQKKIYPRPRLSLVGKNDVMCFPIGVERLNTQLDKVYSKNHISHKFIGKSCTGGHKETAEMRYMWIKFLEEFL